MAHNYTIDVNPVNFDVYEVINDGEMFVSLDTNTYAECYAVIDTDDDEVMDNLNCAIKRKFDKRAEVIGYEDASWMFEEDENV